ncbi:hypothetical protein AWN90_23250 [Nocardia terpenica]|uniref:diacylglycerol O-acyltransferase n=1 Tax=Nocardia terpenica TaxID=455432 RepID=A0A164NZX4_9NOCA|nr:hypothetical protein AWN90_23250 [Nocardia terpenica]
MVAVAETGDNLRCVRLHSLLEAVEVALRTGSGSRVRRLTLIERLVVLGELLYPRLSLPHHGGIVVGGLLRVDGPPLTLEEIHAALRPWLVAVPEFRYALAQPVRLWRRPWWTEIADLDLNNHVREYAVPHDSGPEGLSAAIDDIARNPLSLTAPLWQMWLIHGYADDEWAFLFRASHALFDGVAVLELLRRLGRGEPPVLAQGTTSGADNALRHRWTRDVRQAIRDLPRLLRSVFPLALPPFRAIDLSGRRHIAWTTMPLERLWEAGRRHEAQLGDVYLAALAGALRAWPGLSWRRGSARRVWTMVPASTRGLGSQRQLGNRAAHLRVALPCGEPDPLRRLEQVTRSRAMAKHSGYLTVIPAVLRWAPHWLGIPLAAFVLGPWQISLVAGMLPGPPDTVWYRDRRVREIVPLSPLPVGAPIMAYLLTYGDQACLGFTVDVALSDGDGLGRLVAAEIDLLATMDQGDRCSPR